MSDQESIDVLADRIEGVFLELARRLPSRDPIASMTDLDMGPAEIHVLMWLGTDGPLPMSPLAQRAGITLPHCTRVVDRLKEAGHLLRERDTHDRRVVMVRLSAKGQRLHERMQHGMRQKFTSLLSGFTPEEGSQLVDLLERMATRLLSRGEMTPDDDRKAS